MFRFVTRRLMWTVPTLLVITFLVFVAIRLGTDPVQSYLRLNPTRERSQGAAVQGGERPDRQHRPAVLQLALELRHLQLGQLDQGQPSCLARAAGRLGEHAGARRDRFDRRNHDRPPDRHPLGHAAEVDVRHRNDHDRLRRDQHSSVHLGGTAAAPLRHPPHEMVPSGETGAAHVGGVPARPQWVRPRLAVQAHDPADHRRGDPGDRRVLALHAGIAARGQEQRLPAHRARQGDQRAPDPRAPRPSQRASSRS